jgi:hypothetical protein
MVLLRGLEIDAVRDRIERLIRFALWLEHAENIAAELASRAARYRFLVWSLPLRFPVGRFDEVCPRAVAWQDRTVTSPEVAAGRARAARADWTSSSPPQRTTRGSRRYRPSETRSSSVTCAG